MRAVSPAFTRRRLRASRSKEEPALRECRIHEAREPSALVPIGGMTPARGLRSARAAVRPRSATAATKRQRQWWAILPATLLVMHMEVRARSIGRLFPDRAERILQLAGAEWCPVRGRWTRCRGDVVCVASSGLWRCRGARWWARSRAARPTDASHHGPGKTRTTAPHVPNCVHAPA